MAKIIGKGTFGADSSKPGAQSVTKNKSATESVALDKDGEVVGVALSQETTETTYEILYSAEEAIPKVGDTYEGGVVTAVSESSSNSDFRKFSVTVKTWGSVGGGASS